MNAYLKGATNIHRAVAVSRRPGAGARPRGLRRRRWRQRPGPQAAQSGDRELAPAQWYLQDARGLGREGLTVGHRPDQAGDRQRRRRPHGPCGLGGSGDRFEHGDGVGQEARQRRSRQLPDGAVVLQRGRADRQRRRHPGQGPGDRAGAGQQDVAEISDHDLVDSTALPTSLEGSALSKAISAGVNGAEGHSVNVAASNDSYGDSITQDFIQSWQGQNGTVGDQIVLAPPPLSSSQAQQITGNSPDAVLLIDDLNGFSQLAPALSSGSWWDPETAWGSDQLVSPGLPGQFGPAAIDGMRALAPGAPTDDPASSAFEQDFKSGEPRKVSRLRSPPRSSTRPSSATSPPSRRARPTDSRWPTS